MIEFGFIGVAVLSAIFVYVYMREKLQEQDKMPYDKHLELH